MPPNTPQDDKTLLMCLVEPTTVAGSCLPLPQKGYVDCNLLVFSIGFLGE